MQSRFFRQTAFLVAAVFVIGLCLVDADAQRRRRRVRTAPRAVITNPDIAPPGSESVGPDGERIISTADEDPANETISETGGAKQRKVTPTEAQRMQQKISALSSQIDRLEKLGQANEKERANLEMERLTRAEQRTESLRTQLMDVESKLAETQPRLEEIDYALKPENIERSAAGFGTVRPEEVRDTRRRQLEGVRAGLQRQIKILEASRVRLEAAIITADGEVDRLRRQLELREMQDLAVPAVGESRRPDAPAPPQ